MFDLIRVVAPHPPKSVPKLDAHQVASTFVKMAGVSRLHMRFVFSPDSRYANNLVETNDFNVQTSKMRTVTYMYYLPT